MSFKYWSVTGMLLIKARERPSALITLRTRHSVSPASSKSSAASLVCSSPDANNANSALMSALSAPGLTQSVFARSPNNKLSAPRSIDLPAPDSFVFRLHGRDEIAPCAKVMSRLAAENCLFGVDQNNIATARGGFVFCYVRQICLRRTHIIATWYICKMLRN